MPERDDHASIRILRARLEKPLIGSPDLYQYKAVLLSNLGSSEVEKVHLLAVYEASKHSLPMMAAIYEDTRTRVISKLE